MNIIRVVAFSGKFQNFPASAAGKNQYAASLLFMSNNLEKNMEEKRKHSRIPKKVKSEVHSTEGMTFSTSEDLSYGGIFISTPEPVKIGSEIQLSILTPDEENIDIKGIVRWMSEGNGKDSKCGMGVEFIDININQKSKLKNVIES